MNAAGELAPAKVNLFLHVGPLQPDGYHPVASWMVFTDQGDRLTLEPADAWSFEVSGLFGAEIGGGENLIEHAARLLWDKAGVAPPAARLTLRKQLPVAAGLGGGSSDAGAALRLLNRSLHAPLPVSELERLAAELGADGPACLHARPVLATGAGDQLRPAPCTPPLPAVLVNPRRPSPTGAVYRAYDEGPARTADLPQLPGRFEAVHAVAEALAPLRNDLEAPALGLEPAIGECLELLRRQPKTLLARMSGSGATSFALCSDAQDARELAERLSLLRPGWWVRACELRAAA